MELKSKERDAVLPNELADPLGIEFLDCKIVKL